MSDFDYSKNPESVLRAAQKREELERFDRAFPSAVVLTPAGTHLADLCAAIEADFPGLTTETVIIIPPPPTDVQYLGKTGKLLPLDTDLEKG